MALADISFVRERAIESDETLRKRVADWDGWLVGIMASPNGGDAFRLLEDYLASDKRRGRQPRTSLRREAASCAAI